MVPVGTPQQWSNGNGAFLNNIGSMPGVSVKNCEIVVSRGLASSWFCLRQGTLICSDYRYVTSSYPNVNHPDNNQLDAHGAKILMDKKYTSQKITCVENPNAQPLTVKTSASPAGTSPQYTAPCLPESDGLRRPEKILAIFMGRWGNSNDPTTPRRFSPSFILSSDGRPVFCRRYECGGDTSTRRRSIGGDEVRSEIAPPYRCLSPHKLRPVRV